jgi:hypothetical protein
MEYPAQQWEVATKSGMVYVFDYYLLKLLYMQSNNGCFNYEFKVLFR